MLLDVHVVLITCNLKVEQHTIICAQLIICINSVHYPVRVCAAGLCVWLRRFVYVCLYIYVYMWPKKTGCLRSYRLKIYR